MTYLNPVEDIPMTLVPSTLPARKRCLGTKPEYNNDTRTDSKPRGLGHQHCERRGVCNPRPEDQPARHNESIQERRVQPQTVPRISFQAVSYTHLTLPTTPYV